MKSARSDSAHSASLRACPELVERGRLSGGCCFMLASRFREYVWERYNSVDIKIDHDTSGFIAPRDFARNPKVFPITAIKVES